MGRRFDNAPWGLGGSNARRRVRCSSCLLFVLWSLTVATVANAAGEVEPNDDVITATGPISATEYVGSLSAADEDDWYSVQLGGDQQATLSAGFDGDCYFPDARAFVREKRGFIVASVEAEGSETDSFTTTPAGGPYYIEIEGETENGCNYTFELMPPSAFAAAPPPLPIVSLPEPDDLPEEAHEIGAGAIYTGTLQTVNDVERMYFPAIANQAVDVELAAGGCNGKVEAEVTPSSGSGENSETAYGNTSEWGIATLQTRSGGRFDVEVTGGGIEEGADLGCVWQLLVSPPTAIGTAPPTPTSTRSHVDPCGAAKRILATRRYRLHRLQRTLRFVSNRRRPAIKRQIRSQKRRIRSAKHAVRRNCAKAKA